MEGNGKSRSWTSQATWPGLKQCKRHRIKCQTKSDLQRLSCDQLASLLIQGWVHIQLEVVLQQPPKPLQNSTIQVNVVLLFKQLLQAAWAYLSNSATITSFTHLLHHLLCYTAQQQAA